MPAPASPTVLPPAVLVTGAAKRLGREIALKLAAHGWRVAVHYRDSVEEARQTVADCARLTPGAQAFRSNLGNETAVRNLLPNVIEAFGQVDAVVNCASTFEHDTAATFSFAAMEKHMRSNAGAAILISQALHTHISERQVRQPDLRGVVVNLLDQKLWNQTPDFVSYTLSKAALDAANSMLALALSPLVRVVGVAPIMGQHQPLLRGEKLAERSAAVPSHHRSTDLDTKAAVLLALQEGSISGTTLLVEEELPKDKPQAPALPPEPPAEPVRRHGRR
ncbi:SDR family NAD(P)-dependent oxidoreductase [Rhodoferax sp. GW822-FHT02A01]|uniref:SDR family NAD(P)-dependent oxidoreductase n=1 Tax=Rhodoferax sp. GW822-FHT02A01 TaxID=3141537 RepID=UPI00315CD4AA